MKRSEMAVIAVILSLGIAGMGLGQGPVSPADQDWELVAANAVAWSGSAAGGQYIGGGTNGGWVPADMFLYNKRTGKVFKYFTGCSSGGVDSSEGCFFSIPVIDDQAGGGFTVTPTPQFGVAGDIN